MRKTVSNIVTALLLVIGIGALLYPTLSDWWNRQHMSTGEAEYASNIDELGAEERQAMWDQAVAYNQGLLSLLGGVEPQNMPVYEDTLSLTEQGIMCTLHIPKIKANLTVRHGMDDGMLQTDIGHLPSSSMPVGGMGTHCVLMGHRGLPSAVLFTDLDALQEGDLFILDTLNVKLGYEIDQILTVLPSEVEALAIDPEKDLCTLITCTPYGVNSHRLLVRGHRVELTEDELVQQVQEAASGIDPLFIMLGVAGLILIIFLLIALPKRKKNNDEQDEVVQDNAVQDGPTRDNTAWDNGVQGNSTQDSSARDNGVQDNSARDNGQDSSVQLGTETDDTNN
ncbi:MAG: class C sortase [Atopobiaceae bacterium]|nr:class C sortase [Atopobiaceae bacterium]